MDDNLTPNQRRPTKRRRNRVVVNLLLENTAEDLRCYDFPNNTVQTPELRAAAVTRLKELFEEADRQRGRQVVELPEPRPKLVGLTPDKQSTPPCNDREEE